MFVSFKTESQQLMIARCEYGNENISTRSALFTLGALKSDYELESSLSICKCRKHLFSVRNCFIINSKLEFHANISCFCSALLAPGLTDKQLITLIKAFLNGFPLSTRALGCSLLQKFLALPIKINFEFASGLKENISIMSNKLNEIRFIH